MKRIITTCVMAALAMSSFAQVKNQQYFKVEFTVPVSNEGKVNTGTNTSVSATMKDDYTYCNPQNEYLIFPATNNPCWFDNSTHNYSETSSYYFKTKRTTQAGPGQENNNNFLCDKISKITAFSLPVEKFELLDSTATFRIEKGDPRFQGDYPTTKSHEYYDIAEFTFNRMPRNVEELKTLLENPDGTRSEACNNPLFVGAVCYFIWPRLLECSQDCRDMWNYMYGTQYSALNTYGIANQTFQNACIAQYSGKDAAGGWKHHNAYQFFAGATPANNYKPNGKSYENGPFKVRIGWDVKDPTLYDGTRQCTVASLLLFPNPAEGATKDDISFDYPVGHVIKLRSTKKNGWFLSDGEKSFYAIGKAQYDNDF